MEYNKSNGQDENHHCFLQPPTHFLIHTDILQTGPIWNHECECVCLSVLWSKWICLCCWNACRDKLSFKTKGENLIWECGSNMIQPLDVILVHVLEVTLTLLHQTWLQSSLLCLVVTITLRTVFWHGVQSVVSTLLIESSM